jgi:hypothetical protein
MATDQPVIKNLELLVLVVVEDQDLDLLGLLRLQWPKLFRWRTYGKRKGKKSIQTVPAEQASDLIGGGLRGHEKNAEMV